MLIGKELHLHTRSNKEGQLIELDELAENQRSAIEHFAHCIQNNEQPQFQTSSELSYDAQQIMEGGLRSATTGVEVSLPIEDHLFR